MQVLHKTMAASKLPALALGDGVEKPNLLNFSISSFLCKEANPQTTTALAWKAQNFYQGVRIDD